MAGNTNNNAEFIPPSNDLLISATAARPIEWLVLTPEPPTCQLTMPPKQSLRNLFIPEHILNHGIQVQDQSTLFKNTPEIVDIILGEIKKNDFHIIDRIMLSLTCKSAARLLQVPKSRIPRSITGANDVDSAKRQRLNFTIRLGPWFDDLSAGRDKTLAKHEVDGSPILSCQIIIVENGFAFCISCLKYRRTTIFMKQVESRSFPKTVRWTRCLPGTASAACKVVVPSATLDKLDELEASSGWQSLEVDKKKMPLYKPPSKSLKSGSGYPNKKAKLSHDPVAAPVSSTRKGKSKTTSPSSSPGRGGPIFKKKISAPLNEAEADAREAAAALKLQALKDAEKELEKMKNLTGLEDCEYLPVDASGELRLAVLGVCENHVVDPVKLVGA